MDFRLEEVKYQLLAPIKLKKLEKYDKSDIKREYLLTSADKVEKMDYRQVDRYNNEGLLLQTGSFSYRPNRRVVYSYATINGIPMPVTKTLQYFLGNEEWLDSELYTYDYDSDGFLKGTTRHQPAREIKMTEKLVYKKTSNGYTISKELAPHQLTATDKKLGATYSTIPFSTAFNEDETDGNFSTAGRYNKGKKEGNYIDIQRKIILAYAFYHFYSLNSSFLEYTCKIEKYEEINFKGNKEADLPDTVEYTFCCPEENDNWSLHYIEKSDKKVIMEERSNKYTFEHLGHEIQITSEDRSGINHFTLSGHYTLQQTIMMIKDESYFWCRDFEKRRISDRIMSQGYVNPVIFNFIDTKTENGIERVVQEVKVKKNKIEGKLRLGKPDWV